MLEDITYTKQLSADHNHLVQYLENSLRYAPHPMPSLEPIDTHCNGILRSVRVYDEILSPYFTAITEDGIVNLKWRGFEKGYFEKILDGYNPDAIGNANKFW
ncbi:MAG: hypothetical protein IKU54_00550 [Oscillospiraceae bacterium]|nr:hypothetical protein [Oscillospiraceae bacterium]